LGTLGNKFFSERERRGLTLDDVSNVTKISARMLKAIEEEHFDQLPGGVFNKGFIRAYARHLGLDGEEAVNEYLAWLRQAQVDAYTVPQARQPERVTASPIKEAPPAPAPVAAALPPKKAPGSDEAGEKNTGIRKKIVQPRSPSVTQASSAAKSRPDVEKENWNKNSKNGSSGKEDDLLELQLPKAEHIRPRKMPSAGERSEIPWRLPAAVAVVILLGIVIWNWRSHSARAGERTPATVTASSAALTATTAMTASAPLPSAVVKASGNHSASPTQPPKANSTSPQHAVLAPATQPPPAVTANSAPAKPGSALPTAAMQPLVKKVVENDDVITRTFATASPATSALPRFTLVIRALENSRISVTADGQLVSQETLIAPAHTTVKASREITVKAANGAGVSFLLNGKEIPSQGVEGTAQTFVFDSNGLRGDPQPAPASPPPLN
jgi:cytoskeletal protein RodZ